MGTYSAGSFREQAGNSVQTCFQPAAHVVSATDTSNYSYQLFNCHSPGLFSEERSGEAAEACSGEQVPWRGRFSAGQWGRAAMPELGSPTSLHFPLPHCPLPGSRRDTHFSSAAEQLLPFPENGQKPTLSAHHKVEKGNIGHLLWEIVRAFLVFFTVMDIFVLHIISLPAFSLPPQLPRATSSCRKVTEIAYCTKATFHIPICSPSHFPNNLLTSRGQTWAFSAREAEAGRKQNLG